MKNDDIMDDCAQEYRDAQAYTASTIRALVLEDANIK
jgi:hypothetical protein